MSIQPRKFDVDLGRPVDIKLRRYCKLIKLASDKHDSSDEANIISVPESNLILEDKQRKVCRNVSVKFFSSGTFSIRDKTSEPAPTENSKDSNNNLKVGKSSKVVKTVKSCDTHADIFVSYELGRDNSITEENPDKPRRPVPKWAQQTNLKRAIR